MSNDKQIKAVLLGYICEFEVANTTQLCRSVNRQFRCYASDYTMHKSGSRIKTACPRCKFKYPYIKRLLHQLETEGKIQSKLMKFWDNPPFNSKRTDLFRFWFLTKEAFEKKILSQTLIPYVGSKT